MNRKKHLRNSVRCVASRCSHTLSVAVLLLGPCLGVQALLAPALTSVKVILLARSSKISEDQAPLISEVVFEEVAEQVLDRVEIPMVPTPVVRYCLSQSLQRMGQDLSPELMGSIEEMMSAERTESTNDDWSSEDLGELANRTATELVEKGLIDVPLLNPKEEVEILRQILGVVFNVLALSEDDRRRSFFELTQHVAVDLFDNEESRHALAARINKSVDLPLLGEEQEQRALEAAIDACADLLQSCLPPELIHSLKGESVDSLSQMKEFLIIRVNEKVDLFGLSEEQEDALIRAMVEMLIESYVDPTATDLLLLTPSEQREHMEEQVLRLQRELQLSQARFEREQANLETQIAELQAQLLNTTNLH